MSNELYFKDFYTGNNFGTLVNLLKQISQERLDKEYELEFTIIDSSNNTPTEIFKKLLKDDKNIISSYNDFITVTYKSEIPVKDVFFRSYFDVKSKDLSNPIGSQRKEIISTIYPNLVENQIGFRIKLSKEIDLSKEGVQSDSSEDNIVFNIPSSIQRIIRYHVVNPKYNDYSFDYTMRLVKKLDMGDDLNVIHEYMRNLVLTEDNLLSPQITKFEHDIVSSYQLEIELDNIKYTPRNIYNSMSELIYGMINDNVKYNPEFLKLQLMFNFNDTPNVNIFTSQISRDYDKNNYVWLEKTDGLRHLIIFFEGKMFSKSSTKFEQIQLPEDEHEQIKDLGLTILDTELYKGTYKIFDVYVYDGIHYYCKDYKPGYKAKPNEELKSKDTIVPYRERLSKYNLSIKQLVMKEVYDVEDWAKLIDYVNTNHYGKFGDVIDGVIVQHKQEFLSYKLKPLRLNTVDCLLYWNPIKHCYYLYLRGRGNELRYNLRSIGKYDKFSLKTFGYDTKYLNDKEFYNILFDIPYRNENYKFEIDVNWDCHEEAKQYSREEKNNILNNMKKFARNPTKYNNSIFEMSFDGKRWVPLRHRADKKVPNSFIVGLSNFGLIFSPPTVNKEEYFQHAVMFDQEMTQSFHDVNQTIRTYAFDKYISRNEILNKLYEYRLNERGRYDFSVLDLAGGRGADLIRLYKAGCKNFFVIDSDKEALVTYVKKASNVYNVEHNHVLPILTTHNKGSINLNVIPGTLGRSNKMIINDLIKRYEYTPNSIDIITVNYALHYLCNSYPSLIELRNNFDKLLNENGIVMMMYYDGDKILENYKKITSFSEHYLGEENENNKIRVYQTPIIKSQTSYLDDLQWTQVKEVLDVDEVITNDFEITLKEDRNLNHLKLIEIPNSDTEKINELLSLNNEQFKTVFKIKSDEEKTWYFKIIFGEGNTTKDKLLLSDMFRKILNHTYEFNPQMIMPLPTISATGYREEPLVMNRYLDIFKQSYDVMFEEYPLSNKDLLEYLTNKKIEIINKDYLQYIKVMVLKKKN